MGDTRPIAAAKWPMLLVMSVLLVTVTAATPFLVYGTVRDLVSPGAAAAITVAAGALAVTAIAIAWVLLRQRRERRDRMGRAGEITDRSA